LILGLTFSSRRHSAYRVFLDRSGTRYQLFYVLLIQLGMILLVPKMIEYGGKILPDHELRFWSRGTDRCGINGAGAASDRINGRSSNDRPRVRFLQRAFIISQKAALNRSIDKSLNSDIQVASSQQLQASTYHFSKTTTDRVLALPGSRSQIRSAWDPSTIRAILSPYWRTT
jgi:hypothetical protein